MPPKERFNARRAAPHNSPSSPRPLRRFARSKAARHGSRPCPPRHRRFCEGAPISAFSWSIRGRFDAGRVNLYAASHREEALSAICARVKSKSCHPLPLLSALTQEARLAGNEPIQTGRSSAAQQETHPAAEQKIGPTTGATPSSSLRPQRIRICKGPLQTARRLLQGNRSAEAEKIGTGKHR